MSEYTPRARLVESDLKSYFVDPLSLAITTVRDYGGDRGQISRQIFNKTVSTVEVIEYEGNGSTDPVPDQKAHFHASSTLHLALHVFEHLEDPRAFMAMMMKSFAVQDILFIEVPYEVPNTVFSPGHYEHIQFYTEGSLTQLLSTYDLRVTISNCIGYGRSLPCLQLVAVKNNSSFRIKRETSIALYFYKNLVQSSLGFKIVWFLLAILKRCRLFPHICQYA